MPVDKMYEANACRQKMSADGMVIDEMPVDKMPVGEMPCCLSYSVLHNISASH